MSDGTSLRDWRSIAQEAANEEDPNRVAELIAELSRALDERSAAANRADDTPADEIENKVA